MGPSSHVVSLVLAVLGGAVPSPSAPESTSVTVMAYNVLYSSPEEDIAKSLEVIEKEAPDVLGLRELMPGFVAAFRKRLGKHYPYVRFLLSVRSLFAWFLPRPGGFTCRA